MIGKCPNCGIELLKPPFRDGRTTSELMLTLSYRKKIESGELFRPLDELGFCELCNSNPEDFASQGLISN